jgi:curli biogenesis system outer membrane secretion channel CsgG
MKAFWRVLPVLFVTLVLNAGEAEEEETPPPENKQPPAQDSLLPPNLDELIEKETKPAAVQPAETKEAGKAAPAAPKAEAPAMEAPVVEAPKQAPPVEAAPRAGVPRIAVLPFGNSTRQTGIAETVAGIAAPTLANLFVGTGKVDVIERARLDDVLKEIEFSKSGLVEGKAAVDMGKMLGATHIVTGDVQRVSKDRQVTKAYNIESTKETYNVSILVRVVDAATGKVIASKKAEQAREEILTKYNVKEESDVVTPLAEKALETVVPDFIKAMVPEKKDTKTFVFKVQSQPEGADVEIDGIFEGNCPVETALEAGVHTVKVTLPGYEVWEQKVKVREDAKKPIVARLRPKPETTKTDVNVTINKP